ncbi:hypothetical protein EJ997_05990 [Flaviflexus ciconiae]|uniref:HTH luxR-type domain-containing protein n=1 Tax=Flaviflexus ciconiae TaxID=2496867 RepID=A0A3Q9G7K0_9ACTO|nr:LuxR C-terminal-related transcriptional regulator [Flaviflexus ciconiae]AZQ76952.1 hypothetical protein EJ997_05990 [Flaviflexus ciconiae]
MPGDSLHPLPAVARFFVTAPEVSGREILRHELFEIITSSVREYPISVIEAPSGFGKTTALSLWAKEREEPTVWLTLGQEGKTTTQLFAYLLAALQRTFPESDDLSKLVLDVQDGAESLQPVLESLLDAIPSAGTTAVIIDEAQASSQDALNNIVVPLARYSGGRIRFILSGTGRLSKWMANPLAKGEAIRLANVAFPFTQNEVKELVALSSDAGADAALRLWEETGGWPVAVRLLLQIGAVEHPPVNLKEHTPPSVLTDYIEAEILEKIRPELREFILDAVIADRVNESLASEMTGSHLAASYLEECRTGGLFLDSFQYNGGGTVYRWHSTFALSCREIAERTDPARVQAVHRRAAGWMADPYPAEAIFHALQTGDDDFAVAMINEVWMPLVMHGHTDRLEERCLQLPRSRQHDASIMHIRSVCRHIAGDTITSELLRTHADAALERLSGDELKQSPTTMIFTNLQILSGHAELTETVAEAEKILAKAALSKSQHLHYMYVVGSTMIRLRTNPRRAIELLTAATMGAREMGLPRLAHRAAAMNALALAFVGKFHAARQIIDRESADNPSMFDPIDGSVVYWSSMFVAYWQGDIDQLIRDARVLDSSQQKATWRTGMGRLYFAATATIARHDLLDEALVMLDKIPDTVEHGLPWPAYKAIAHAGILWARGKRPAAVQALERIGSHDGITTVLSMAAEMWRRLGYPNRALKLISKIDKNQLTNYTASSIQFTQAVIAWDKGDQTLAHNLLDSCLTLAVPESIASPFVGLDESSRALILAHIDRGTPHEHFLTERLATSPSHVVSTLEPNRDLSRRETEILQYLATPMSAEEIAESLFISPATVRSHQRSIYRKLGVKRRRDAVRVGLQ